MIKGRRKTARGERQGGDGGERESVSTPCVKRADGNGRVTEEQTTPLATEQEISGDREAEGGRRARRQAAQRRRGEEHLRRSCTPGRAERTEDFCSSEMRGKSSPPWPLREEQRQRARRNSRGCEEEQEEDGR